MKNKKIVIITAFYLPHIGGLEKQLDLWANTFINNGAFVTLHTNAMFHKSGTEILNDHFTVIRVGDNLGRWATNAAEWVKKNCDEKTIIIVGGIGKDIMQGMLGVLEGAKRNSSRVILNIPTSDHIERALKTSGTKQFLTGVDTFISVSPIATEKLKTKYKNVYHVPNYLSQEELKTEKATLPDLRSVAFFGRISARKRVDLIPLIASILPNDIKVIVQGPAGYGEDELYTKLCTELNKAGVKIILPNTIPAPDVANSLVYINPSDVEGFSIALLEAMHRGNIPVLSDIPENRVMLDDTSLLCKPIPKSYAKKIIMIFNMPINDRISIQYKLRKRVLDQYSENIVAPTLIKTVLGKNF
jgi:glycosyltransferase involved in cell wall biosynthesis